MKKTRVLPFGDRVLVIALSDTNSGSIIIPDKVREKEKPVMGKVVEVASAYLDKTSELYGLIELGDVLIFADFAGMKVKISGSLAYVLEYRDIQGKLINTEVPDEKVL